MWGAIYWLINFPLICCLFFFTPTLWLKLGIEGQGAGGDSQRSMQLRSSSMSIGLVM